MQKAALVLHDVNAACEQLSVQRLGRITQQTKLYLCLQNQRDRHTARHRSNQRAAKANAGKEVRIGDDHLIASDAQRTEIRQLDLPTKAEVVAHHKLCLDVAARRNRRLQLQRRQTRQIDLHQPQHAP